MSFYDAPEMDSPAMVAKYNPLAVNATIVFPLATRDHAPIPIDDIANQVGGFQKKFPSSVFNVQGPPIEGIDEKTQATSLFRTGKAVQTGGGNIDRHSLLYMLQLLSNIALRTGISIRAVQPAIHNYVLGMTFPRPIDICALAAHMRCSATYDPMLFPGLRIAFERDRSSGIIPPEVLDENLNVTCVLYMSGKAHITGCRSVRTTWCIFYAYARIIERFEISREEAAKLTASISSKRRAPEPS